MSYVNEEGRPEPPLAGDEVSTFLGSLERQRATFAWKCGGLDAAGMHVTVGASSMTIAGLVKHLALVEDHTFSTKFLGRSPGKPWEDADWDSDPDWEWHLRRRRHTRAVALPMARRGRAFASNRR